MVTVYENDEKLYFKQFDNDLEDFAIQCFLRIFEICTGNFSQIIHSDATFVCFNKVLEY